MWREEEIFVVGGGKVLFGWRESLFVGWRGRRREGGESCGCGDGVREEGRWREEICLLFCTIVWERELVLWREPF